MTSLQHISIARTIVDDVLCARHGYITLEVQQILRDCRDALRQAVDELDKEQRQEKKS